MCMCGKPTRNGEPGYSWDGKERRVRAPDPPDLRKGDVLLHDEPGRCGGLDSHSYHYRVVLKNGYRDSLALLVRHGGGDERVDLGGPALPLQGALAALDSTQRYWLLNSLYHAQSYAARAAQEKEAATLKQAFVDGRLRKRKTRGRSSVKVWVEPRPQEVA